MWGTAVCLGLFLIPLLTIIFSCIIGDVKERKAGKKSESSFWSNLFCGAIVIVLAACFLAIIPGILYALTVVLPADKVDYEETAARYQEVVLMKEAIDNRGYVVLPQDDIAKKSIEKYNEDAEWLRNHYDHWWYGELVDDRSAELEFVEVPKRLE